MHVGDDEENGLRDQLLPIVVGLLRTVRSLHIYISQSFWQFSIQNPNFLDLCSVCLNVGYYNQCPRFASCDHSTQKLVNAWM